MAFVLALVPASILERLLHFLGISIGPLLCACSQGLVPNFAAVAVHAAVRAAARMLGRPCPLPRSGAAPWNYATSCRKLLRMVVRPLLPLTRHELFYPGFNELALSYLVLITAKNTESPETFIRRRLRLPGPAESLDLTDYLAVDLGLSPEPLTAWLQLNNDSPTLQHALRRAIMVLRRGRYTFQFYPYDCQYDRPAVILVSFAAFGIAGVLVAVEPDVDPAGFYV